MADRRWALREATALSHHALDTAIGGFSDRDSYARYLTSNYRFRAAAEHDLRGMMGGWQPRRLLPALGQDMADLGLPLPDTHAMPAVSGSALLGRLYVLEGAALGGQILRRQAQTLGLTATHGARHLAGDAANWAAFLNLLNDADPYDAGHAAEGACATFDAACTAFLKEPT